MLPFLAAPRRYMLCPAATLELAYLRRRLVERGGWLRLLDGLLILFCVGVAATPLRLYITHETRSWIFLMMTIITGLHFAVALRTLLLAGNSITREKRWWDEFVLTGLDARQIVLGKWWAIIRYTAGSHLFVALLRLGLALAYTQYMHKGFNPLKCPFGGAAFCHVSYGYFLTGNGFNIAYEFEPLQPPLWKIVLAGLILVIFALLEVALLSAIGITSALMTSRNLRVFLAIAMRGILFIAAVLSIFATETNWRIVNAVSAYDCTPYYYPGMFAFVCPEWALLMETTELGIATFGDNGNFIAAMVMRPVGNDLFVFRNVAGSAFIGVVLYGIALWLALRVAQILVIRQKALRPYNSG